MKNRIIINILLINSVILFLTQTSCKKDEVATDVDKTLLSKARDTVGFVWYKYSDELLDKSSGSGHNYAFFKTRFNATASVYLDDAGKVINGTIFPEGSLIVKELYSDENTLGRYAIL